MIKKPSSPWVALQSFIWLNSSLLADTMLKHTPAFNTHCRSLNLWLHSASHTALSDLWSEEKNVDLSPLSPFSRTTGLQLFATGPKTDINSHSNLPDRCLGTGIMTDLWRQGAKWGLGIKFRACEDSGRPYFTFPVTRSVRQRHLLHLQ